MCDISEPELSDSEIQALTAYNDAMYDHECKNWIDYVYNLLWACELGQKEARIEYLNLNNLPDYTGVLKMVQETLEQNPNNSYFLTFLGYMYETGHGVETNQAKAIELYEQAIYYENGQAMCNLAMHYNRQQEYTKSFDLLNNAVQHGYDSVIDTLADMYFYGWSGPKNYNKAKELYKQAIALGYKRRINNLGYLHMMGLGTKINHEKAKKLFEQAAAANDFTAITNIGFMYHNGYGSEKDPNKAKMLYLTGIENNVPHAANNLGFMLLTGEGGITNFDKARELFEKAIEGKIADAALNLSNIYRHGLGIIKNEEKADELVEQYKVLLDSN